MRRSIPKYYLCIYVNRIYYNTVTRRIKNDQRCSESRAPLYLIFFNSDGQYISADHVIIINNIHRAEQFRHPV